MALKLSYQLMTASEVRGTLEALADQIVSANGGRQVVLLGIQRRGIPMGTLQALAGIATPIAGLGQSSTGTSTQTTATPFNPLSLLPLAFAPLSGGSGGILGNFGAGALSGGMGLPMRGGGSRLY